MVSKAPDKVLNLPERIPRIGYLHLPFTFELLVNLSFFEIWVSQVVGVRSVNRCQHPVAHVVMYYHSYSKPARPFPNQEFF